METENGLRRRRAKVEAWLDERNLARTLSASRFLLHQELQKAIRENGSGRLLEVGSGGAPFKEELDSVATHVTTLDIVDRYGTTDVIADVQSMPGLPDRKFDTVLCTQVLEHVADPSKALSEMRRVLRDDGTLILSAPHLSMIHEAPEDYFRYTEYGLRSLCKSANFETISSEATGGLIAFLVHPLSLGVQMTVGSIPGLRWLTWAFNYVFLVRMVAVIDRALGAASRFPLDHVVVAHSSGATRR